MSKYLIYSARFPDGSLYIGRTGGTLAERIDTHYLNAKYERRPISLALRKHEKGSVIWMVLFETDNVYQSKGREIAELIKARKAGEKLLNLTRGGFYDPYDAGMKKATGGWNGRR